MNDFDLLIIGGGAAGFFAAITASESAPGLRIAILEKGNALLGKVRVSGGGRCNVTHACFDPAALVQFYPRGAKALRGPFSRFQPKDTVEWFARRGVTLKTERDGRMFPTSNSSQTIVDCFIQQAEKAGVRVILHAPVERIEHPDEAFTVTCRDGSTYRSAKLLMATGGDRASLEIARQLGHTIVPPVPSLFTFNIADPRLEGLAGVSVQDVHLRLPAMRLEQNGPLLVTHWGLSGPSVLKLSAWAARPLFDSGYRAELEVNFMPGQNEDSLRQMLVELKAGSERASIGSRGAFASIPQRLWKRLCSAAGIQEDTLWGEISKQRLTVLAAQVGRARFEISGKGEFKDEFVTCGGVALDEIDFKTLQSRRQPGLYFAGEILDIDALTGGFNFQAAWTTAWHAAVAIAVG